MKRYFVYYVAFSGTMQIADGNAEFECAKLSLGELVKTLVAGVPGATHVVVKYLVEL